MAAVIIANRSVVEIEIQDEDRIADPEPNLENSEIGLSEQPKSATDNKFEMLGEEKRGSNLNKTDAIKILLFACLGNMIIIQTARIYPSGFFVQYLEDNTLNPTLGTVSVSAVLATSALATYIVSALPRALRTRINGSSLKARCLVLSLVNCICCALVAVLDPLLELDNSGRVGFGVLLVVRAVQGICIGLLFVLVQGELVDLYLKGDKFLIVIVSGAMHLGTMVSSIVGTELYVAGGWTAVGFGLSILGLVPLLALPWVLQVQNKILKSRKLVETPVDESEFKRSGPSLTVLRKITFFMPDVAMFLNNIAFSLLIFVLPARKVRYEGSTLSSAVLVINLLNVCSLLSSLLLGYIANRKVSTLTVMLLGNISFYAGCLLAYGSTTEFLAVPFGFEIGAVLVGIGDAAIINLNIMSKFVLYEGWGLTDGTLGRRSTAISNLTLNLSSIIGTVASGLSLSRASEVPVCVASIAACVIGTAGLVMCKIVR